MDNTENDRKTSVAVNVQGATRAKLEEEAIKLARQFFGGEAGELEILPFTADVKNEYSANRVTQSRLFTATIEVQLKN